MEFNKQTVKALLGVVCGGIAFAAALLHLDVVAGAAGWLLGILSPLLLGCAIAFILNVPMRTLERCLFPHAKKANKLRRPLALLLTVAAVSAVLALAGMVIVPGVRDAVASIAAQVPEAFERLQESAARFQEYLPLLANQIESLSIDWAGLSQKAVGLVQNWGKGLLISGGGLVSGIVSGVTTFFIGLIFSLYILLQKEKLARQGRQLCYAFLPEAAADQLLNILRLSERTFSLRSMSGGRDPWHHVFCIHDPAPFPLRAAGGRSDRTDRLDPHCRGVHRLRRGCAADAGERSLAGAVVHRPVSGAPAD